MRLFSFRLRRRAAAAPLTTAADSMLASWSSCDHAMLALDGAVRDVARAHARQLTAGLTLNDEGDAARLGDHCRRLYAREFHSAVGLLVDAGDLVGDDRPGRYEVVAFFLDGVDAMTVQTADTLDDAIPAWHYHSTDGAIVYDAWRSRYVANSTMATIRLEALARDGAEAHDAGIPFSACPHQDAAAIAAWQEAWVDRGVELQDQADVDAATDTTP